MTEEGHPVPSGLLTILRLRSRFVADGDLTPYYRGTNRPEWGPFLRAQKITDFEDFERQRILEKGTERSAGFAESRNYVGSGCPIFKM
jgi:hypothetical protein